MPQSSRHCKYCKRKLWEIRVTGIPGLTTFRKSAPAFVCGYCDRIAPA